MNGFRVADFAITLVLSVLLSLFAFRIFAPLMFPIPAMGVYNAPPGCVYIEIQSRRLYQMYCSTPLGDTIALGPVIPNGPPPAKADAPKPEEKKP